MEFFRTTSRNYYLMPEGTHHIFNFPMLVRFDHVARFIVNVKTTVWMHLFALAFEESA
jgi:hypothetical protein